MLFLDPWGIFRINRYRKVQKIFERAALAGKPNRREPNFPGFFHRGKDIFRISAGAQSYQNIPAFSKRLNFPGKNRFIIVIVRDRRQSRAVRSQSDRRESPSFFFIPPDKFGREMLGLGKTPPVPANQKLPAVFNGIAYDS